MLDMDHDDSDGGDGPARWFPPSAPPLSPPLDALGHAPWIATPPVAQGLTPTDFRQYPGNAYTTIDAPPPAPAPFAFPGRSDAPRPDSHVYMAQRVDVRVRRGRRRSAERRSYNLTWAFSVMARFVLLLLFHAANGVLGLCGAAVVWTGAILSVATLPLCGFGIVLFHSLLRLACYLCQVDVVIHNAMADADHKIAFQSPPYFAGERESLLPTRVPMQPTAGGFYDWRLDQGPALRFEKTLYEASPRSTLAVIYFGTVKPALGLLGLAAVMLLLVDVGFLMGDKRVQVDIPHMDEHPLTVYLASLALLLAALVLVHGLAEISQRVTRFFCCEVQIPLP